MAIKIILHNKGRTKEFQDPSDDPNFTGPTMEINVRKNLRGDYMIMDHTDIDVVYSQKTHKVSAFAKNVNVRADLVYDAQNRLFQFLAKRGVIDPESVQGGALYSSMEADVFEGTSVQENQVALFTIGRFIEQERPFFRWKDAFRDNMVGKLTDPDDEHSTELGDVDPGDRKGVVDPSGWMSGAQYQLYESKEEYARAREFADRIQSVNKINQPAWALVKNKWSRIWDFPFSNDDVLGITVSWDGEPELLDIPLKIVKRVAWFDIDQYEEQVPVDIEPTHVEVQ
jgi:hypothetical protein